ncbi:hypothetical protein GHT06_008975 [Daphnia sinensis]|uniref:Uncharacterized protein n=1 Tax=Daphnia sinensis TaxID=1820382 RepID=A0AAD5LM18_9CRUS|nr:hypothetical protein GHT06_008975 [Daphnia sinensis]
MEITINLKLPKYYYDSYAKLFIVIHQAPTLVNASKGKSIKNSKESRKYADAVVERSVYPLSPFLQLAIKENVSHKPLAAVNTMVKKPESIKSVVKKPETAIRAVDDARALVNQGPILAFIKKTNSVATERDFFPFPVDDENILPYSYSLGDNNLDDRICNIWAAIVTDKWGMSLSWAGLDASKYAIKTQSCFISFTIYKAGRRYLRAQAAADKWTGLDDEEDLREGMSSADMAAADGYYEKEMALEDGNQDYNNHIGSDEE